MCCGSSPSGQGTQSTPSGTIAFALSCVLVSLFKLSLTQYVDDFPQVEPRASAESALVCEAVLALLGWEIKQVERQDTSFSSKALWHWGWSTTCMRQSATCL